jgi:molybdopterin-binding protein
MPSPNAKTRYTRSWRQRTAIPRDVLHSNPCAAAERTGALTRVTVIVDGLPLVAALTTRSADELALTPGVTVIASFKAMAVYLY